MSNLLTTVVYEKPIPHINLVEWHSRQYRNEQINDQKRDEAFRLRHESRQLRDETRIRSQWDTYYNNVRLGDRVTELDRWRDALRSCLERIGREHRILTEEKMSTERELDSLGSALAIVTSCISMRDNRLGTELTYDEADTELKKELAIIDNVKSQLAERCQAAWVKLNKLDETRFRLNLELTDKSEARDIDKDQLTLDKNCANITYKIDSLKVASNSISYEAWLEASHRMKDSADAELADTHRLREALFAVRERSRNELTAQRDRVDFVLRKRVYETQKARNELEWQTLKMRQEMDRMLTEVMALEGSLQDKVDALKLAETRLENRGYRPGNELESDSVERGLHEEVAQLRITIRDLLNQLDAAKINYNGLEDQLTAVDRDLNNKNQSLMTDIRCLDMRLQLRTGEFAGAATDTDRNIKLTRMEHEIPSS